MMHRVILLAVVLAVTKPTASAQVALEQPQKRVTVECCPEGGCPESIAVAIQEEKSKKSDKATQSNRAIKIVRSTDDGSGAKVQVLEGPEALKALDVEVLNTGDSRVLRLIESAIQEEKPNKPKKSTREMKVIRSSKAGETVEIEVEADPEMSGKGAEKRITYLDELVQEEKGSAPATKALRYRVVQPDGANAFRMVLAPDSPEGDQGGKAKLKAFLGSVSDSDGARGAGEAHLMRWVTLHGAEGAGSLPLQFGKWSELAEDEKGADGAMSFAWSSKAPQTCCEAPSLDAIRKVVREEITRALKSSPKPPHPSATAFMVAPSTKRLAELAKPKAGVPESLWLKRVPEAAKPSKPEKPKGPSEADRLRREMKELVKRIAELERAIDKLDR